MDKNRYFWSAPIIGDVDGTKEEVETLLLSRARELLFKEAAESSTGLAFRVVGPIQKREAFQVEFTVKVKLIRNPEGDE